MAAGGWRVERATGPAAALFATFGADGAATRLVRVLQVHRPALVLGSTQPAPPTSLALSVDVVRRRSGGGAVLLRPHETVWVDVAVPAGDPLWVDDVGRSFHWLGDVWARALGDLGVEGRVHRGGLVPGPWSPQVCFAGIGAGEVVAAGGGKVVGMASRRTRDGALFQCAVPLVWDARAYVDLLGLPAEAAATLAGVAAPARGVSGPAVVDAFLASLP